MKLQCNITRNLFVVCGVFWDFLCCSLLKQILYIKFQNLAVVPSEGLGVGATHLWP